MSVSVACSKCKRTQVVASGHNAASLTKERVREIASLSFWTFETLKCQKCPECSGETEQSIKMKWAVANRFGGGCWKDLLNDWYDSIEWKKGKKAWKQFGTTIDAMLQFELWAEGKRPAKRELMAEKSKQGTFFNY